LRPQLLRVNNVNTAGSPPKRRGWDHQALFKLSNA